MAASTLQAEAFRRRGPPPGWSRWLSLRTALASTLPNHARLVPLGAQSPRAARRADPSDFHRRPAVYPPPLLLPMAGRYARQGPAPGAAPRRGPLAPRGP